MSAHRIHYTPERVASNDGRTLALIALLGFATFAIGLVIALILHGGAPVRVVTTPIRTPDVQILPLEPIDSDRLVQLRVEAFRAGYQSAVQTGCRPALVQPLVFSR